MEVRETIFALSSGAVPSGVAVVRISGDRTRFALETLKCKVPAPRFSSLQSIRNRNDMILDKGLVLFFQAPSSFTGEDCAELHLHGGRAVVDAVLSELSNMDGLRLAEAGEFTKRAFDNNKIDLTEAEGLSDLIAAETEMQRRLASSQAQGTLRHLYNSWADAILRSRALIEAELDFSDEDDIPGSVSDQVWENVRALSLEIREHLDRSKISEIARDGFSVVIAGPPNAGKSSLLNVLAGRDVAIVSDVKGTTRDILEVKLDINGFLVRMKDTAGLRQTSDKIELLGIERARDEMAQSDLVIVLSEENESYFEEFTDEFEIDRSKLLLVQSKTDLIHVKHFEKCDVHISAKSGVGINLLLDLLAARLGAVDNLNSLVVPGRQRHIEYLALAREQLVSCLEMDDIDIEVRSEHLRIAQECLGRITGRTDVEDLLGVIFSEFCVGK